MISFPMRCSCLFPAVSLHQQDSFKRQCISVLLFDFSGTLLYVLHFPPFS